MKKIIREDARKFAFDYNDKPLIHVKAGERLEIETWDAGSGFLKALLIKPFREIAQGLIGFLHLPILLRVRFLSRA